MRLRLHLSQAFALGWLLISLGGSVAIPVHDSNLVRRTEFRSAITDWLASQCPEVPNLGFIPDAETCSTAGLGQTFTFSTGQVVVLKRNLLSNEAGDPIQLYAGTYEDRGHTQNVALKSSPDRDLIDGALAQKFLAQTSVNILEPITWFTHGRLFWLVLPLLNEHLELGQMMARKYVDDEWEFPIDSRQLGEQLIRAVDHIHQKGLSHGNVKPKNLIGVEDGRVFILKMIDFDTVTLDTKVARSSWQRVWSCPELVRNARSAKKALYNAQSADVWATARIIWQMIFLYDEEPEGDDAKELSKKLRGCSKPEDVKGVLEGSINPRNDSPNPGFLELMSKALCPESMRINSRELLEGFLATDLV